MGLILHEQLETDKTRLTPLAGEISDAMMAIEGDSLLSESRLKFPRLFQAPPVRHDDYLQAVSQRLQYEPGQVAWWGWLFLEKESRNVLGTLGVSGLPSDTGAVGIAFSIYSDKENLGCYKSRSRLDSGAIMREVAQGDDSSEEFCGCTSSSILEV